MKKYTFLEFLAASESDDFDIIKPDDLEWANTCIDSYEQTLKTEFHGGDCTNESYSCSLCHIEYMLADYKKYIFNEEKWRENNGISPISK